MDAPALLAVAAPAPPALPEAPAPSTAAAADGGDAVARIGAALAYVGAGSASKPADRKDASDLSLATDQESRTNFVHVASQQSWLPPVSPDFASGPNHPAPAGAPVEQDASKVPATAAGQKPAANQAPEAKEAPVASQTPAANPRPVPATASDAPPPSPAAPFAGRAASATAPVSAQSSTAAAPTEQAAPAPTLRRDLEITMAPRELGGMSVKMKSSGDRLEIAFVADRGETARMISDSSSTLESQLRQAGVGRAGIEISSAAAGPVASGAEASTAGGGDSAGASSQRQPAASRNAMEDRNEATDGAGDSQPRSGGRGLYL